MGTITSQVYPRLVTYVVGVTPSAGPFAIPFLFYDNDTVQVFVGGVRIYTYTVTRANEFSLEGNFVTLDDAVANTTVSIWSDTGGTRSTGDTFVQAELSREIDRIYARFQEINERAFFQNVDGSLDATGRKIANVGTPAAAGDAATKGYVDSVTGIDQAAEAAASAAAAAASEANAAASESAAVAAASQTATDRAVTEALRGAADSVVIARFVFTASAGQTVFTGADDAAQVLAFNPGNALVLLNGVFLIEGTDFTATGGNTVTLAVAVDAGDQLIVVNFSPGTADIWVGTTPPPDPAVGDLWVDTT